MSLRVATVAELRSLVSVFEQLDGPIDKPAVRAIGESFGWILRSDRARGMNWDLKWSFGPGRARARMHEGNLAEVGVDVSEEVTAAADDLSEAFSRLHVAMVDFLGEPAHRRAGINPSVSWDLVNGGRVGLRNLGTVVQLAFLRKTYADIERFEESRGISPDRDPEI